MFYCMPVMVMGGGSLQSPLAESRELEFLRGML